MAIDKIKLKESDLCPCGTGLSYASCCKIIPIKVVIKLINIIDSKDSELVQLKKSYELIKDYDKKTAKILKDVIKRRPELAYRSLRLIQAIVINNNSRLVLYGKSFAPQEDSSLFYREPFSIFPAVMDTYKEAQSGIKKKNKIRYLIKKRARASSALGETPPIAPPSLPPPATQDSGFTPDLFIKLLNSITNQGFIDGKAPESWFDKIANTSYTPIEIAYNFLRPKQSLYEVIEIIRQPQISSDLLRAIMLFNRITNSYWSPGDDPSPWFHPIGNTSYTPFTLISPFVPEIEILTQPDMIPEQEIFEEVPLIAQQLEEDEIEDEIEDEVEDEIEDEADELTTTPQITSRPSSLPLPIPEDEEDNELIDLFVETWFSLSASNSVIWGTPDDRHYLTLEQFMQTNTIDDSSNILFSEKLESFAKGGENYKPEFENLPKVKGQPNFDPKINPYALSSFMRDIAEMFKREISHQNPNFDLKVWIANNYKCRRHGCEFAEVCNTLKWIGLLSQDTDCTLEPIDPEPPTIDGRRPRVAFFGGYESWFYPGKQYAWLTTFFDIYKRHTKTSVDTIQKNLKQFKPDLIWIKRGCVGHWAAEGVDGYKDWIQKENQSNSEQIAIPTFLDSNSNTAAQVAAREKGIQWFIDAYTLTHTENKRFNPYSFLGEDNYQGDYNVYRY